MPHTLTYHEPDKIYLKDGDEIESWIIDWSKWLKSDTISASAWYMAETTPSGITVDSESNSTTTTTVTLSSGYHGSKYVLSNRITTAAGLVKEKKLIVRVLDTEQRHLCN